MVDWWIGGLGDWGLGSFSTFIFSSFVLKVLTVFDLFDSIDRFGRLSYTYKRADCWLYAAFFYYIIIEYSLTKGC